MSFTSGDILEVLNGLTVPGATIDFDKNLHTEFTAVTNHSRNSDSQSVFIAITGVNADGHDFIVDAISKGVRLVVHQQDVPPCPGVEFVKVTDSYAAYARLAELAYGFPANDLKLIAVTGTNGKTTTAYLLKSILQETGKGCGLISTVEYAYPGHSIPAARTTPDALEFQQLLCEFRRSGCEYAVMETSSHALHQNRIGTANFATAIFTNLSGDHLDYHLDMESYFSAKKILFEKHLKIPAKACINIDDTYGKRLVRELPAPAEIVTFGRGGEIRIIDFKSSCSGTELNLSIKGVNHQVLSPLFGDFNTYNIAGAVAAATALGISMDQIIKGIKKMNSVPGRMESFPLPNGALAVVDYAHTDDALANVLETLRKIDDRGSITVVFGCGGDRDRTKRPRMGAVAAKFADNVVLTSDNPRTEEPMAIINGIAAGLPPNCDFSIISDRKTAIEQTLSSAKKSDIILIAGKGHETYQEINGVKYPFDDRVVVKNSVLG